MTEQIDEIELADTAEDLTPIFERAFNSGRISRIRALFEEDAMFVPEPGTTVSGAEMYQSIEQFLASGLPLKLHARHTYVVGDIAHLVVDEVIDGTGPDGKHVHMESSGTDVVRRGSDGKWRYVIANRLGTAQA